MKLTGDLGIHVDRTIRKRSLSLLILFIVVASILVGCGQGQPTATPAIFSTSGANVSVMKEGTASWVEAEVGMSLRPGDCIKCGGNSGAEITFLDGSTIELQAGTEVEVVALNISTETGSATIRVRQTIGRIIFRVTKIIDPASRYEVETPAGVVAIRGSAVEIYVTEDGTTWICNLEGDIWAVAQGVELQIPEGRCCVIRPGQPPTLICDLTISSTTGGNVTTPGEGTFSYDEGSVVNMTAEAEEGYQFGSWTGDVDTIGSVNAAITTITMQDNYSVTANFKEDEVVTFPDPNLEAAVRDAVAIPTGPIYASDLDGLTYLDASGRNITSLGGLECATSLTSLILYDNLLMGIEPLTNLTNLTHLELSRNFILDVSPLAGLTNLTYLAIRFNDIEYVSHLANLTNLTELWLGWNKICYTEHLANLTSLTLLDLNGNQIGDISHLAGLTNLTQLSLAFNNVGDISPLENLTNLTLLQLTGNRISNIVPLANLHNLTFLQIGDNWLSDISPLQGLTSLRHLDLEDNDITGIAALVQNQGLRGGAEVWLGGNPLNSDSIDMYIPELEARGVIVHY